MVNEPEKSRCKKTVAFFKCIDSISAVRLQSNDHVVFLYIFLYLVIISQKIIFQVLKKGRTGITADSFAFQGINKNAFSIENVVCAK